MTTFSGLVVILGSPNDDAGNLSDMGKGRATLGLRKFRELSDPSWSILVTGGFGDHFNRTEISNALYTKNFLLALGAIDSNFVEFALSCNTVDDALQSRSIIDKYHVSKLIIVSSDFHLPRVEFIFRSVFPECTLSLFGAEYLASCSAAEQERLTSHEQRELQSLHKSGESIVGGRLSIHSWKKNKTSAIVP